MNLTAQLSKREWEMLPYLVSDKSVKQIADEILRSVFTVENHNRNIKKKVGVSTGKGLCIWYFIQHFKIPIEDLPKSMIAFVFLCLFMPLEFKLNIEAGRNTVCRTECVRSIRSRNEFIPTIEF